jgi:hypothetical protein
MKSFIIWFCSSLGLGLFLTLLGCGPEFESKQFIWTLAVTVLFWMGMLAPVLGADEK